MRTFWVTTDSKYWASLVVVLALLAAPAAAAQEEAFFNLSSQGFVLPGQIPSVEFSGRGVTEVDLRIYRIPDPEAFFLAQANIRSPRPVSLGRPVAESASMKQSLREIQKQTARGYRDLTRAVFSSELRSYLTESSPSAEGPTTDAPAQEAPADEPGKPPVLSNYPLVREISQFLKEEERPGWWMHQSIPLFASAPDVGVYLVEAVAVGKRAYTVAMVTNLRYVAKQGPSHSDRLLVFVASADSGSPVSAAKVKAFDEDARNESGRDASTNNQGVALLPAVRGSQTLMVSRDDDFLLGDAYFYFAAEDWDSDVSASGRRGRVYIYTDRPVYRPGHQVSFKALLRSLDTQGRYTLARSDIVQVTAMDPMNRSIYSTEATANGLGSIEGDLPLSGEPALGTYTLKVDWADRSYYGHFRVEEYKKPEFEVTVSTDEPNYIAGDRMGITFNAMYYFGDPVAGGKLEYEVYHADYWRPWWEDFDLDWYFAGDGGYHTYNYELLQQGDAVLDRQGRFMVEVPTEGRSHDAVFRIVARVTDQTNREISGAKIVPVAAGTYSIGVSSERYATATGNPMTFSLTTKSVEGDPVSEELELKIIRRSWEEGRSQEETIRTVAASTDDSGTATFEFAPQEPGSYQLDVQGEDERGNRMQSEYNFWVWSDRPWWAEARGGGLTLTPDRKMYTSSETAELLLLSPVENPTVLFTVEGPTLFEHRILQVSGTTASIPLFLEDRYSPNVYISATVISGGRFYEKSDLLVIPPSDRFLNISIDTDRPTYKPGEEVEIEVKVENEQGRPVDAEVSIGVVDLAIYAIAPDSTPDIRTYFYGKRPNEVRTNLSTGYYMYSSAREALASEPAEEELAWADFKTVAETKVRKTFKDTMFWQAVVRTGPTGTVKVPVKTPDNLTTWRITIRATDRDTRVGQETATFITRKDIMVRLGLPRFFRNRDTGVVTATVHNSQETPADVRVQMEAEGIQINSPLEKTLHLEEQSSRTLTWDYSSEEPGAARFTVYALSEDKSDAEERRVPILPHGLEITQATNAVISAPEDDTGLTMSLPGTELPENLVVDLSLSPSLAGPVLNSLDYLIGYPYGCVEQTMSQFLPTVLVTHTLQDLGIEALPLVGKLKEIPQMVDKGLSRLYNHQHGDGGWGWWEFDGSDPFMTGYVMYGLARAQEAGFAVDEGVVQRGMSAASEQLRNPDLDVPTRLYLLYVLSVADSSDRTMIEKLYKRRQKIADELTPMSRAHMVLTLHRHGFENEAIVALDELLQTADRASGYIYWEGAAGGGLHWRTDSLITTAAALEALLAVNPEHEDAGGVVRYLMSRRKGPGHWRSTLDTAQIVYALMEYMNARRELFADFDVEVTAGGASLLQHHFSRDDLFAEPMRISVPTEAMADSREIEIHKRGRGNLYATLTWRYFSREENIEATQAGPLSIRRKYYRLNLEKKTDGSYSYRRRLLDQGATVKPGDLVLVTLVPRAAEDTEYLMIEDLLPSGFEVIEDIRGWRIDGIPYQEYTYYGWGYWYSHREVRDDRVAFFSRYFGRGSEHELYYIVRAQTPGDYHIMPARIELMYYPESRGTSAEMRLRVESTR